MNNSKPLFTNLTLVVTWTRISDFYKDKLLEGRKHLEQPGDHYFIAHPEGSVYCPSCMFILIDKATILPRSRSLFQRALVKEIHG